MAHQLHPLVRVGSSGLTENVLAAVNEALECHELIKVQITASDRDGREQIIAIMLEQCSAELIQRVGHIATLYRRNPDEPVIRVV